MNMKIIRGTTPTFNFTLPFKSQEIANAVLTFSQNGEKIIQADMSRLIMDDDRSVIKRR